MKIWKPYLLNNSIRSETIYAPSNVAGRNLKGNWLLVNHDAVFSIQHWQDSELGQSIIYIIMKTEVFFTFFSFD
jgi:hypothetical protein